MVTAHNTNEKQIVVFSLAEQYFGIDISTVAEIIRLEKITALPQAPAYVEGVINIRGQVLPVLDLHILFGVGAGERSASNRVIIVDLNGQRLGLIVGSVYEVKKIAPDSIQPAPSTVGINQKYIEGIILGEQNLIVLINLAMLFSGQELKALKKIGESA